MTKFGTKIGITGCNYRGTILYRYTALDTKGRRKPVCPPPPIFLSHKHTIHIIQIPNEHNIT